MKKPTILPGMITTLFALFLFIMGIAKWGAAAVIFGLILIIIGTVIWSSEGSALKVYREKMNVLSKQAEFLYSGNFNENIEIYINDYRSFSLDETRSLYYFTPSYGQPFAFYDLNAIVAVSLSENNNLIVESSGGTGGAIVGGLLFGATGAIIGSTGKNTSSKTVVDSLCIKIITSDLYNPSVIINFLDSPVNRSTPQYQYLADSAERIYATLQSYLATKPVESEISTEPNSMSDSCDQIRHLKSLSDDGIITQEEFESKKKQLLGL